MWMLEYLRKPVSRRRKRIKNIAYKYLKKNSVKLIIKKNVDKYNIILINIHMLI